MPNWGSSRNTSIMDTIKDPRLAVLIDADNVASANIKEMLEEIAKYGTPTFKRIYADWTKPHVAGWKTVLLENAITPVQQYSYTTGKNSTDSAMIIDAMDILYTERVDGFCIVSSDSDFTRLATRLREAGMKVYGLGERKTPVAFISACDKFIYLEILKKEVTANKRKEQSQGTVTQGPDTIAGAPGSGTAGNSKKSAAGSRSGSKENAKPATTATIRKADNELVKLIADSINDLAGEDGWTFLGELGSLLLKKKPDFDPRNYGFRKLVPLIKSLNQFEIDERNTGRNNSVLVYVRVK